MLDMITQSALILLHDNMGKEGSEVTIVTRLGGDKTKEGTANNHVVRIKGMVGFDREKLVATSIAKLEKVVPDPGFVQTVAREMLLDGIRDEVTGNAVTVADVTDAVSGEARGRTGLLTSLRKTSGGLPVSTYTPLFTDLANFPFMAYNGDDQHLRASNAVYVFVLVASETILEQASIVRPSKMGAVRQAKAWISKKLGLPTEWVRVYKLQSHQGAHPWSVEAEGLVVSNTDGRTRLSRSL